MLYLPAWIARTAPAGPHTQEGARYERSGTKRGEAAEGLDAGRNSEKAGRHTGLSFHAGARAPSAAECPGTEGGGRPGGFSNDASLAYGRPGHGAWQRQG